MQYSKQQLAFFSALLETSANIILIAVAGAGKTTTILEAIHRLLVNKQGTRIAYAAFNRAIKRDASDKLGFQKGCFINTFHGFGLESLTRSFKITKNSKQEFLNSSGEVWIDSKKTAKLCAKLNIKPELVNFVVKVVSQAKQQMIGFLIPATSRDAWLAIVEKHDLTSELTDLSGEYESEEQMLAAALRASCLVLQESIKTAREFVDFDDMIYLPVLLKLHIWQYDYVFIDEAQDTNPARRCLAKRMLKTGGRLIAVGDPKQAIYGFTGADNDSLEIIKQEFSAVEMPLTVSYRCPQSVVDFVLSHGWHDCISAADSAIEGDVSGLSWDAFQASVKTGDAILCRVNAPLLKTAYSLIAKGLPVKIEGRNIAANLNKLVTRWKSVHTLPQLVDKLSEHAEKQSAKLMASGKEMLAQNINDQVDCLLVIIKAMLSRSTLSDLRNQIDSMFIDSEGQPKEVVLLSSIHKAKGREFKTVYWLDRSRYQPSKYARQQWQQEQETNLMYVAATRAQERLIEISSPNKD